MLSSRPTIRTLEEFPDEILLLICRYLSSVDVLFSFYGLNSRLLQTISGYCRHVVLAQVPFKQFSYICDSILPNIGTNICSLVVSNEWKGILSKAFLSYFGERMSLTFPRLKHLTLIAINTQSLILFVDCLQNLTELVDITINTLWALPDNANELQTLLYRILIANNNSLNSIIFDYYSDPISVDTQHNNLFFFNIEKLHINLKTIHDLHRVLTIVPRLCYLRTQIAEEFFDLDEQEQYIPVSTLKCLHLESVYHSWSLDELTSIIKRIPNVEELSIAIESSDDIRLFDGEKLFSLLSTLSLQKFNYYLQFHDLSRSIDHTKILSTWKQFKEETVCIKSDDNITLALYTLPFIFSYSILPSSLAKNEIFIESYAPHVKKLISYDITPHVTEIFSAIEKCHKIRSLSLQIDGDSVSQISKQTQLCRLPYLTTLSAWRESVIDTECFQRLLEVSPNLYKLKVNYEVLQLLLDNEYVCRLLRQRITNMYILISLSTSIESVIAFIYRLVSTFPSMRHFYFFLEKEYQFSESLILAILNSLSQWNYLVSFGVVNAVMTQEILSQGIRQWVMKNSTLHEHNSFVVDYSNEIFRVWL